MDRRKAGWPMETRVAFTFRHRAATGFNHRPNVKSEGTGIKGNYRTVEDALIALASNNASSVFSRPISRGLYEVKRQASRPHGPNARLVEILCTSDMSRSPLLVQPQVKLGKAASLCLKEGRKTDEIEKDDKISVKFAMRDRDWMMRNRMTIMGDIQRQILRSFGVTVQSNDSQSSFKVYVAPGNNQQLVKKAFANRWWWSRTEDKTKAHLLWTQWKDRGWLGSLSRVLSASYKRLGGGSGEMEEVVRYSPYPSSAQVADVGKVVDLTPLGYELVLKSPSFTRIDPLTKFRPSTLRTHNKLEGNHQLINKKALFLNMRTYYEVLGVDPFTVIPLTYFVKDVEGSEMEKMVERHREMEENGEKPVWIVKPGENTNRGTGIALCRSVEQVKEEIRTGLAAEPRRTFILQHYVSNPFLINRRKFDLRLYVLLTCANGILQAYYYTEGYLRTSSKEFTMTNISNKLVHLTNDAVQKQAEDYGKYEVGNKLAYTDFQRYLDMHCRDRGVSLYGQILPRIKAVIKDTIQAVYLKLDPWHRAYSFEILGYDFLLDEGLNPWLIEVNTNPCLELSSPLLARIIPSMLENALR